MTTSPTDLPPILRHMPPAPDEGDDLSAFVDGLPLAGPSPAETLTFPVGEVPAASDRNGDGRIGPDEAGRRVLLYRMAVGAGARNGRYENLAVATDVCAACAVSNSASAAVEVIEDPLFELGTLIGKVFNDEWMKEQGYLRPNGEPAAYSVRHLQRMYRVYKRMYSRKIKERLNLA